ncbi:hypothetical protein JJB11_16105 [Ramlibacter ginsenosidimutans]|uniref:Uncharacterized protein n=1 Tax=Ramlibacter ginsenosidimutans TaxID=502333 RepID=A0A934WNJ1_9BURK|nr:hypothetical protein [Ramlibacter ginsenosidimutans]MBK6007623.1 hypothetical protein [Ramlibacter ginsenosidimutans]
MAVLIVAREAADEIDALYESDEDAAADIDFLIEQLFEDHRTLEELCLPRDHFDFEPAFEIKRFGAAQRLGKNVYSAKLRSTADNSVIPYRLLVGFDAQRDRYHVLSIAHRNHAYDTRHPHFAELLRRYDDAGIPTYR